MSCGQAKHHDHQRFAAGDDQHGLQLALLIGAVFGGGGVPVLMVDLCHQCRFSLQGIDAAFSAGAARLLQTVIPRSAAQGHAAVIFFYRHV